MKRPVTDTTLLLLVHPCISFTLLTRATSYELQCRELDEINMTVTLLVGRLFNNWDTPFNNLQGKFILDTSCKGGSEDRMNTLTSDNDVHTYVSPLHRLSRRACQ
ncbi:hypothetical protein M378DRAFT_555680 [Amanita muscaria Koide BX008]|uniref:Uncharacterized protein n=1 Tax=Amanita muscaria (strain Koide BX008) TaxID=946122 RepID=A0A0C2X6V5_AMAMK|nr:hypothetical protein M378DRAFT_555680 [Amanita muscaria Koide BX008]